MLQEEAGRRKDVEDEDAAAFSSSFWHVMKQDTYNCLECMDRYMDAKREVLLFLEASAEDHHQQHQHLPAAAGAARLKIDQLDRRYLAKQLVTAQDALMQGTDLPDSFVFALFDLLVNYQILQDPIINQT